MLGKQKRRLLWVDDDPDAAREVASQPGARPIEVRFARGAVECLRTLGFLAPERSRPRWFPDVLVVRWKMAEYDGTELLHIVRADPITTRIRVILLAHHSPLYDTSAYLRALPRRADAYVFAPCTVSELLRTIDRVLAPPEDRRQP